LQEDNIGVVTTNQKAHTLCKRAKLTHKQLPFVTPMGLAWQSHKSLFDFAQAHIHVHLSSFNERITHRLFEKH
jgi:hypothetical protein